MWISWYLKILMSIKLTKIVWEKSKPQNTVLLRSSSLTLTHPNDPITLARPKIDRWCLAFTSTLWNLSFFSFGITDYCNGNLHTNHRRPKTISIVFLISKCCAYIILFSAKLELISIILFSTKSQVEHQYYQECTETLKEAVFFKISF